MTELKISLTDALAQLVLSLPPSTDRGSLTHWHL